MTDTIINSIELKTISKNIIFFLILLFFTGLIGCGTDGNITSDNVAGYSEEKTIEEDVDICANGHIYTEALCTKSSVCINCGEVKSGPLGHVFVPATCTEPMKCEICGVIYGEPLGHVCDKYVCTEDYVCNVCKEVLIPAAEHDFSEATCTNPMTCLVCGATQGEALGHKGTVMDCTQNDYCSVCGELIRSAGAHDFTAATCTEPQKCKICGATQGGPLGHQMSEATCTTPSTCSVCGYTNNEYKDHSYTVTNTYTDPKYKYTVYTCSICGAEYTTQDNYIDENSVYNAMIALQETYPTGTKWDNTDVYYWKGGYYSGGGGCAGFAFMLSDAAFGNLPARRVDSPDQIRVGDILRLGNDTHSVIVLSVESDGVVVAEGNMGGKVLWERKITWPHVETGFTYLLTRYPS